MGNQAIRIAKLIEQEWRRSRYSSSCAGGTTCSSSRAGLWGNGTVYRGKLGSAKNVSRILTYKEQEPDASARELGPSSKRSVLGDKSTPECINKASVRFVFLIRFRVRSRSLTIRNLDFIRNVGVTTGTKEADRQPASTEEAVASLVATGSPEEGAPSDEEPPFSSASKTKRGLWERGLRSLPSGRLPPPKQSPRQIPQRGRRRRQLRSSSLKELSKARRQGMSSTVERRSGQA